MVADEDIWVEALGETEGVKQAEVRAQVSGILEKIVYKEGDRVKEGDTLKKGDLIGSFDAQAIREAGCRTVTPVVVTNADDYAAFRLLRTGETAHGADVLRVE